MRLPLRRCNVCEDVYVKSKNVFFWNCRKDRMPIDDKARGVSARGAMLYVVSDEMIPETHAHGYEKDATFSLLLGFLLVLALQRIVAG